jgi:hypothetical protein
MNSLATLKNIREYTEHLGLTCDLKACQDILDYSNEWEIADTKTAVWEFLDTFEGIAHSADLDFFKNEDKTA